MSGGGRRDSREREKGENNYYTEMCSGSEVGSYLRLIDFVYHSTLGLRVIKKKKRLRACGFWALGFGKDHTADCDGGFGR